MNNDQRIEYYKAVKILNQLIKEGCDRQEIIRELAEEDLIEDE